MEYQSLPARLEEVRRRIKLHGERAGRTQTVKIIAVTKGHPVEAVQAAMRAGLTDVGENRVQEGLAKQDALGPTDGLNWHLIGSLQRNKARQAIGRFGLIHSVDRAELVTELARRVGALGRQRVLVEVNCSGEDQKGGVVPEQALTLIQQIAGQATLGFEGLMTMAALTDDEKIQRHAFASLRQLKSDVEAAGIPVAELSMGMSGDYPVAVEEGATMVRLGTVLFGERNHDG